jgi:putative PIN family toxin of toxin-antitoxin system
MRDVGGVTSPRYVLDTNVCLDLFVFDDPRCTTLLAAVRAGEIELVTREDCRAEWLAVLAYPELKSSAQRQAQAIEAFDRHVRCIASPDVSGVVLPRCRDRDDQKFLELAQQAGAVALLTRDNELLRLARRAKRDGLFAILSPALWQDAINHPK